MDKERNVERIPRPGEFYRHIENKLYQIIAVAEHTENGEELVVYQALYGSYRIFATPLSLFNRKVDLRQHPRAGQEYCFEPVKFWSEKRTMKSSFAKEAEGEEFLDEEYSDEDYSDEDYGEEDYRKEPDSKEDVQGKADSREDVQGKADSREGVWEEADSGVNDREKEDKERDSGEAIQWLERFLDAQGYEKQLEVLTQMRGKVGSRELASICLVLGIPVLSGDEDSQIANIKKHLETRMRYDTRRLR